MLGLDPVADHDRLTQMLGVQLQESELQEKLTVREALELYAAFYPNPADWRSCSSGWASTGKPNARFGKLSGGQKQRLFIALALIGNPRVVVLDELTTGLDPRARRDTWELIEDVRARGVTVLLVTHFMEEAQRLCDRIAVIDTGRIAALDTPAGLIRRSAGTRPSSRSPRRARSTTMTWPRFPRSPPSSARTAASPSPEPTRPSTPCITLLARHRITAHQLRVTDATLDDAFLDLTADTSRPRVTAPRRLRPRARRSPGKTADLTDQEA